MSCGIVSAVRRSNIGFNEIEDFIQTDAAVNPGMSGGALVDPQGRLVGLIDGIFTKEADIDAGVNFAISVPLIQQSLASQVKAGVQF
jgi:S1-C subfamily serine protease